MFTLLKYAPDKVSGRTEVKVMFRLSEKGEDIFDGGDFSSQFSADTWLDQIKRDYITRKIENYVLHKKHILEGGDGYKSSLKMHSLGRCQDFLRWACISENPPKLMEVCSQAIKGREAFEKILPVESNPSYSSSRDCLAEIMNFCKKNIEQSLLKSA